LKRDKSRAPGAGVKLRPNKPLARLTAMLILLAARPVNNLGLPLNVLSLILSQWRSQEIGSAI